jgi:hypothetical protein
MTEKFEGVTIIKDADVEKGRELSPAEVVEALNKMKERYVGQLGKLGAVIVFPEGTRINDRDVSGQSLETILNTFIDLVNEAEKRKGGN